MLMDTLTSSVTVGLTVSVPNQCCRHKFTALIRPPGKSESSLTSLYNRMVLHSPPTAQLHSCKFLVFVSPFGLPIKLQSPTSALTQVVPERIRPFRPRCEFLTWYLMIMKH